jgi:hypothetical protein
MDKDRRLDQAWEQFREQQKTIDPEQRIDRDDKPTPEPPLPRKPDQKDIDQQYARRWGPQYKTFEKRFQIHLEHVCETLDYHKLPDDIKKNVIEKFRDTYRQFEIQEYEHEQEPGYDPDDPDAHTRHEAREEFMFQTQFNHIRDAQPKDPIRQAFDRLSEDHDKDRDR